MNIDRLQRSVGLPAVAPSCRAVAGQATFPAGETFTQDRQARTHRIVQTKLAPGTTENASDPVVTAAG
jgi:hypothetical protein